MSLRSSSVLICYRKLPKCGQEIFKKNNSFLLGRGQILPVSKNTATKGWGEATKSNYCIERSCSSSSSVQFSSVAQSCPTLCDLVNRSTPGLPVHHHLPEFTQTHVHQVRDAIQPSHPLLSPSPPAPNPSQHQNLFQ